MKNSTSCLLSKRNLVIAMCLFAILLGAVMGYLANKEGSMHPNNGKVLSADLQMSAVGYITWTETTLGTFVIPGIFETSTGDAVYLVKPNTPDALFCNKATAKCSAYALMPVSKTSSKTPTPQSPSPTHEREREREREREQLRQL